MSLRDPSKLSPPGSRVDVRGPADERLEQALEAAVAGDARGLTAFHQATEPLVVGHVRRFRGLSPQLRAEQVTFISHALLTQRQKIARKWDRSRPLSHFLRPFIARASYRWYRGQKRALAHQMRDEQRSVDRELAFAGQVPDAERVLITEEQHQGLLTRVLEMLPPDDQILLDGWLTDEPASMTAGKLDITLSTYYKRKERLMQKLAGMKENLSSVIALAITAFLTLLGGYRG